MSKKWLDTGYLKSKPEKVDREAGMLYGVKVCSEGEAQGHGVHLDSEFIDTLVMQGNAKGQGLKARFGHPNMCSTALGTFLGRFTNFSRGTTTRDDGSKASCCLADLSLSESAKDTPNGDLHSYVLSMAEKEADMFGTSIVFTPGREYRRDKDTGDKAYRHIRYGFDDVKIWYTDDDGKKLSSDEEDNLTDEVFVECEKLWACDCVDDPAANDGMFSSFANETIAGQITEFLDLNPKVFQALEDNPDILRAVAEHGDKFDEFVSRYRDYRAAIRKEPDMAIELELGTDTEVAEDVQIEGTLLEAVEPEKTVDVEAAVQAALKADRERADEITDLGEKFGFAAEAKVAVKAGKTADQFRQQILNKSSEDWEAALKVKNPSTLQSEDELTDAKQGADAVASIKARRATRYGG